MNYSYLYKNTFFNLLFGNLMVVILFMVVILSQFYHCKTTITEGFDPNIIEIIKKNTTDQIQKIDKETDELEIEIDKFNEENARLAIETSEINAVKNLLIEEINQLKQQTRDIENQRANIERETRQIQERIEELEKQV